MQDGCRVRARALVIELSPGLDKRHLTSYLRGGEVQRLNLDIAVEASPPTEVSPSPRLRDSKTEPRKRRLSRTSCDCPV